MDNCPVCNNENHTKVNTEFGIMAICMICGEDYYIDDKEEE